MPINVDRFSPSILLPVDTLGHICSILKKFTINNYTRSERNTLKYYKNVVVQDSFILEFCGVARLDKH